MLVGTLLNLAFEGQWSESDCGLTGSRWRVEHCSQVSCEWEFLLGESVFCYWPSGGGRLKPSEKVLHPSQGFTHTLDSVLGVLQGRQSIKTRCAMHGLIYLWDLKSTTESLKEKTKKEKITEKKVRWKILSFCRKTASKQQRFLNTFLFWGEDARPPQVERHRQLQHEPRLPQGELPFHQVLWEISAYNFPGCG